MEALATLPVFFKLGGKRAVLAGGSEPALWKAELLAAAGADVDVYAERLAEGFEALAAGPPAGSVRLNHRAWTPDDLAGAAIAIGAIGDDDEAQRFVDAARSAGLPVNVIDRPEFCQFQFGSIVNRSPLVVAISTDGAAPVFGQAIRSLIETLLPDGFKRWAQAAKDWRREGARLGTDMPSRRRFWSRFSDLAFREPQRAPTERDLEELIGSEGSDQSAGRGFVSLVGAGPGDPDLLTLAAVRALRSADVVLYDGRVPDSVVAFARREAERVLIDAATFGPSCQQRDVMALVVRLAREGKRVVRLKPGDPMLFGRGSEEMAALEAAGIAFDVVPGITPAQAAASRLKVSLTHRDGGKRVQFITGHARDGQLPSDIDWRALADPLATTVVFMALGTLPLLTARLLEAGVRAETQAIALYNVGLGDERVVRGTIASLSADVAASGGAGAGLVMFGAALQRGAAGGAGMAENVENVSSAAVS